jgi:hypothetical protein
MHYNIIEEIQEVRWGVITVTIWFRIGTGTGLL